MKKLIILSICLVIISYSFLFASPFHGGDGSSSTPYQIYNETELLALVNANSAATWSSYFILTNNITCSSSYMATIGNSSISFTGNFNGQGHTIYNLSINLPTTDLIGLFGYTSKSATITNVNLSNANITGRNYVGALVGVAISSIINNCTSSGHIYGGDYIGGLIGAVDYNGSYIGVNPSNIHDCLSSCIVNGDNYIGGLIGGVYPPMFDFALPIYNCSASGNISCSNNSAGGLIGTIGGELNNCTSSGNVYGANDYTGGLVGENYATVNNCSASGNVTGGRDHTGGLCGFCWNGTVNNSSASCNVYGGRDYVGGLNGSTQASWVYTSFSTGNVYGGRNYVGGFTGYTDFIDEIKNCYSKGNASGNNYVGGFIGNAKAYPYPDCNLITNCYSIGIASATTTGTKYQGGFCGYNATGCNTYSCCFWDTETSGTTYGVQNTNVAGVTGLTDMQMRDESIFSSCGWNYSSVWHTVGITYPELMWVYQAPVPTLTEWARYILIFSVLLVGCYFVYRKLYS